MKWHKIYRIKLILRTIQKYQHVRHTTAVICEDALRGNREDGRYGVPRHRVDIMRM
jgi:hypothetical protein